MPFREARGKNKNSTSRLPAVALTARKLWGLLWIFAIVGNILLICTLYQSVVPQEPAIVKNMRSKPNSRRPSFSRIVIEDLSTLRDYPPLVPNDQVRPFMTKSKPSYGNQETTLNGKTKQSNLESTTSQQVNRNNNKNNNEQSQNQRKPSSFLNGDQFTPFSFCLLIKDDNDILNEWIAYHYHVLNLRHIIVALDPSSHTSPIPLLEKWKNVFGLDYEVWDDTKFMPEYFLNKQYDLVPRMIKIQDKNATKWQDDPQKVSSEHLQQDYVEINNHRYRQAKFLQYCSKAIQDSNQQMYKWMTHIDTDEYITLNPTLRYPTADPLVPIPQELNSGSLINFLKQSIEKDAAIANWPCISMPRIFYGSVEDEKYIDNNGSNANASLVVVSPSGATFDRRRFETLRWKYHADYSNDQLNKQPKAIMDVSGFPPFNLSLRAFSVHRPSMHLCRRQGQMNVYDGDRYPLVVQHYLGSFQRYQARQDPRRTETQYWNKSAIQDGKDDDWIDGWLSSFVREHGMTKVSIVLGTYMVPNSGVAHKEGYDTSNDQDVSVYSSDQPRLGKVLSIEQDSLSACLLVKDDNAVLNEWIAYHYHLLKLRTIIIAVDPSSTTSPSKVLDRWRKLIDIQEWEDSTYMPDFFLRGQYDQVPNLLGNVTTNSSNPLLRGNLTDEEMQQIHDSSEDINNHRYRQITFLSSCVQALKEQNKTWMVHIDTDEYIVMHPQVRQQDHWRQLPLDPTVKHLSLFHLLKLAVREHTKAMNYPCISMPRLLFGSIEDEDEPSRFAKVPKPFNGSKFETLRWKYHSNYDEDVELNGKPKVIMDLSGAPPKAAFLSDGGVYSIHRPALHICRRDQEVLYSTPHKMPLTINHYVGSWERYNHRNDSRRSRSAYEAKAFVQAGKDDDWIDGWVDSFVQEHGLEMAKQLLKEYTTDDDDTTDIAELEEDHGDFSEEENDNDDGGPEDSKNSNRAVGDNSYLQDFDGAMRTEFSACLLVKDDNDILNEWIAYHYHVLGLRYLIVAIDSKSHTSPSILLDKWKEFGMTIEEWTDEMFMPDIYFQKAYWLQPRLVKMKKNKEKWLEGIDDPDVKHKYYHDIQDHRFRQITFLSSCIHRLKEQGRSWTIHIDTDEYVVLNPILRRTGKFDETIEIPPTAEASIIPQLLNRIVVANGAGVNYPCVSLPRLLYGSVEDASVNGTTLLYGYNQTRFESLRWKYHADYQDSSLNKQPKVILDVSAIPEDDKMFTEKRVFSIHRPSKELCRSQGEMYFDEVDRFPFSVNHYLGTFERFSARDDLRRNHKLYDQKANIRSGKDSDNWIDTWLPSFVETHGEEKVSKLLGYYWAGNQF